MKPHFGQPVLRRGVPLEQAEAAMILVHGRGATADSILTLVPEIETAGFAYYAPQAANNTWYPYSFLSPTEQNEPGLSSGLYVIAQLLQQIEQGGVAAEKTVLLGFSQGACLTLEFAARNPRRYGGIAGLSGGLIGPDTTTHADAGDLEGTPIFLGCSDVDFHVPKQRVHDSTEILQKLGGQVTERLYPGMGHTVNLDEIEAVREMCLALIDSKHQ